jgi:predicted transcriptional regulator
MTVELPPILVARVTAFAIANQQDPETLLAQWVREALDRAQVDAAIRQGVEDVRAGRVVPAEVVMQRLLAR